jgi:hypothetical protein
MFLKFHFLKFFVFKILFLFFLFYYYIEIYYYKFHNKNLSIKIIMLRSDLYDFGFMVNY